MRTLVASATLVSCLVAAEAVAATLKVPSQFATIQAAVTAAVSGDTVLIAKGTYFENVTIATAGITLKGSGANTIIDARPDPNFGTGAAVRIVASDVTVTNLRVRHAAPNGFMVLGVEDGNIDIGTASNVTLSKLTSEHPLAYHVRTSNSDGLTLDRCTFKFGGRVSIEGDGVTVNKCAFRMLELALGIDGGSATITGNKFEHCPIAILSGGDDTSIKSNSITNATLFAIFHGGANGEISSNTIKNGTGIFIPGGSALLVSKNKLSTIGVSPNTTSLVSPGAGIFVDGVIGITIEKNSISDCSVPGMWLLDCTNAELTQNTVTRAGLRAASVVFGGGPTIPQARGAGIYLQNGTGHSIVSNKLSSCVHDGILVEANGVLIDGNQSSSHGEDGIEVIGDNGSISDNVMKSNLGEGLDLSGNGITVSGNTMTGNRVNWRNSGALGATSGNSPAAPDTTDVEIDYDALPS
ncbi:MAG: right-handed parallel beta-helix repeat-containing protein [Planctomycetes bacterium]|nr:right-handed parallel beta-helix repeat-containing protein [Planctomycetota bacterium]